MGACVTRGFNLTTRHFGFILLVGLVYFAITMVASMILAGIDFALGIGQFSHTGLQTHGAAMVRANYQGTASPFNLIVSQVLSSFLSLGVTRIGLNLVSGKAAEVGMMFGEGRKLLRALGATILFGVAFFVGLLLLIVPGVYIALRYGQYLMAIVDRDLGIMEAFHYSSSITTNNRGNILLLGLLSFAIAMAGMIACFVGLIFAIPVVWLTSIVAYRWMQYGPRAAMDHPGTITPQLAGL